MIQRIATIFLLIWTMTSMAQNDSIPIPVDEASVLTDRQIGEELSQKYTGDEFNYEVKTGESSNLLARFIRWVLNGLGETFGLDISPQTLLILEYIIYGLMGLLAIYLLVRMFINEKFNAIFSKKAKSIVDIDLSEHHIEAIDLDALMDAALKQKDYRLAVRYQFLRVLKLLSQKSIIEWHFDKTNLDYGREIKEARLQEEFKKASYLYENIWYGEQPIDEQGYAKTSSRFDTLNLLIP
ncbi:DUF4129 domain-containing protein [Flagellimonas olearia]|uniref:Protein-glutamine gamma-glutamyltransferase-like C-terminal domain-containing protein n=1 Tax=Flagellimonas olearia TaxID=552546 RepID=A0A444VL59_9FLAO|nr:DUF4129 domain-containing protein [Allomuricauda olearia]RYC51525.1 hypothetical protein DN53_11855 [Allomuricauda olearia]